MAATRYIAIDLGAESGRIMLGTLEAREGRKTLSLRECHRFQNIPMQTPGGLRWNIPKLWEELRTGITSAKQAARGEVQGISTDSWGVDYVLVGRNGEMIAPPFSYRDPRHAPHYARLLRDPGRAFIFANTGIQFMSINTLYQLCAESADVLQSTETMLPIADYFNWRLAGKPTPLRCEVSSASTTQLLDACTRRWSDALIERAGIPRRIFPELIESGTKLGECRLLPGAQVIASASHDTACAVAAVPAEAGERWGYISSGTWSLAGVELSAPILTDRCRDLGFTNEAGIGGTTRLLKNIGGLYILQQCRAVWQNAAKIFDYAHLAAMAERSPALRSLIRPESSQFAMPGDMPARIAKYCSATHQPEPRDAGQFVRCIYDSMALLYRKTFLQIEEVTGQTIKRIYIVGGGAKANLLNQLCSDACGVRVIAGPEEATAIGNMLITAQGLGHIAFEEIRHIVRDSTTRRIFEPKESGIIAAANRFDALPVG